MSLRPRPKSATHAPATASPAFPRRDSIGDSMERIALVRQALKRAQATKDAKDAKEELQRIRSVAAPVDLGTSQWISTRPVTLPRGPLVPHASPEDIGGLVRMLGMGAEGTGRGRGGLSERFKEAGVLRKRFMVHHRQVQAAEKRVKSLK